MLVDGKPERRVRSAATGSTRSSNARSGDHLLELRFEPGLAAYAFTFG